MKVVGERDSNGYDEYVTSAFIEWYKLRRFASLLPKSCLLWFGFSRM